MTISIHISGPVIRATRADGALVESCCGDGAAFSATELLAAALGSCIAASLAPLLARHEQDERALRITVARRGRSVNDGFDIQVALPASDALLQARCRRAAENCPVRQALAVPVTFNWNTN